MIEVIPARGSLGTAISCLSCPHEPSEDAPDEWVDANEDVFFAGASVDALKAFLARHGGR
jgi:hypothetical protein